MKKSKMFFIAKSSYLNTPGQLSSFLFLKAGLADQDKFDYDTYGFPRNYFLKI